MAEARRGNRTGSSNRGVAKKRTLGKVDQASANTHFTIKLEDALPSARRGGGGKVTQAIEGRQRQRRAATKATKEAADRDEQFEYDGRVVWVSGEATPQSVAHTIRGAALPDARDGFPCYVLAKRDKAVNVGVKGVITAARYLMSDAQQGIGMYPTFRENRNELTLKLELWGSEGETAELPHEADPSLQEAAAQMIVGRDTDPRVLAGAIAKNARDGQNVSIRGIGSKPVFEMLRAVGVARQYLASDGEGTDLVCFPDFTEVQFERRADTTAALRIFVMVTEATE